jgi:hypothetical protein
MAFTPTTQLLNTPLPRLTKVSKQQHRCGKSSNRGPFAATGRQQQGTNPLTNQPTMLKDDVPCRPVERVGRLCSTDLHV